LNYLRQSLFGLIVVGILCSIGMVIMIRSHVDTINGGRVAVAERTAFETEADSLVIQNVRVLSPDGSFFLNPRSVLIEDGTIVSINQGDSGPEGARLINAQGRYLIPGLIDGNVDLRRQPNDLLVYLANGVTHVRDLSGQREDLDLASELESGRPGPTLSVASPKLYSAGLIESAWMSMTRVAVNLRHPERAVETVGELAEAGYDAISIDASLDPDVFQAITTAAGEIGMRTIGRLPDRFDLTRLASTSLSELARTEDLVERLLDEFSGLNRGNDPSAFLDHLRDRSPQLADALLSSGTAVNSTLWFTQTLERQAGNLLDALKDLPLAYANPAMVEGSRYAGVGWLPGMNRYELPRDLDAERRVETIAIWQTRRQAQQLLIRELADRGVPIIAGSNATAELMIPGFSLHDELEMLNRIGLSPTEALRAATQVPAAQMGLQSGVIEPGRDASLVLLNSNPLVDISNTRTIAMVIRDGQVYDRDDLAAMLEAVRQAHARSRKFDLARYQ